MRNMEDWVKVRAVDCSLPSDFPAKQYDKVHSCADKYRETHSNEWNEYIIGWLGVARRYRALVEYDEEFTESIGVSSVAPPGEERYRQERAYFGFCASAVSMFECFFFSAYCIGSILKPDVFPMSEPGDLRGVNPILVSQKYAEQFSRYKIQKVMRLLITDCKFADIKNRRDVLSHRGSMGRNFALGRDGLSATMPRNVKDLPDQWDRETLIDVNTTASLRQWISDELEGLVDAAALFCKARL